LDSSSRIAGAPPGPAEVSSTDPRTAGATWSRATGSKPKRGYMPSAVSVRRYSSERASPSPPTAVSSAA